MSMVSYELLVGFLLEAQGYVKEIRESLAEVKQNNGKAGEDEIQEIHRRVHTLRGAASMLELDEVTEIATGAEDMLEPFLENNGKFTAKVQKTLASKVDQIEAHLETLREQGASLSVDGDGGRAMLATTSADFDIPEELLEIFTLEAQEHSETIHEGLEHLRGKPADFEALSDVRRATHTLKGSAASVGFGNIAHVAHFMEDLLEHYLDNNIALDEDAIQLLFDSADAAESLIAPQMGEESATLLKSIGDRYEQLLGDAFRPIDSDELYEDPQAPGDDQAGPRVSRRADNLLRLPISDIDKLINRVGEIVINRSGLEGQLGSLKDLLTELDYSTRRMRRIAADIDDQVEATLPSGMDSASSADGEDAFDSIEMDRYTLLHQFTIELEEVASDTGNVNNDLTFLADDLDGALTRERRLTTELQDGLMATRLVTFRELETRLRRTMRRTANDLNKQVDLVLTGFETEVDKTILDTLSDPLMHMLRNAVDHGIESPNERQKVNKPITGLIRLDVSRERGRVVISLGDDGRGIDTDKIQQHAVQQGYAGEGDYPTREKLLELLFEEGFSTADEVTQTSGRGVGLDIVRRAVSQLQGTVRINTLVGQGSTVTISVPVTLAITRALFVRSDDELFAVPLEQISSVIRLTPEGLDEIREQDMLRHEGEALGVFNLAEFVSGRESPLESQAYGLLVESGEQPIVVLVDQLAGTNEAVVKSLGSHLRRVFGVSGATISGDGGVVLILDLVEVTGAEEHVSEGPRLPEAAPSPTARTLHVLVVDDSLSVRRVVSSFLERSGIQTTTAKDGVEALEALSTIQPDAALVDIEMPRMNGYELLSRIKADLSLKHIPVVFLTSRSAAKHRKRAADLNVDGYLVKPYREEMLLEELTRVTQKQI